MPMQLSDVVNASLVLVVLLGLSPVIYKFIGELWPEVGLLTRTILSLLPPLLFVMLTLSAGVASRGGG